MTCISYIHTSSKMEQKNIRGFFPNYYHNSCCININFILQLIFENDIIKDQVDRKKNLKSRKKMKFLFKNTLQ